MPGEKAPEHERREQILSAAFEVAVAHGLAGVTTRRVAARAGLSAGLVLFHFKSMDALLVDLLEWCLARISPPAETFDPHAEEPACDALADILGEEIQRIGRDRALAALFLDFWMLGTRRPEIRSRIRHELARYRAAFRDLAARASAGCRDGEDEAAAVAALAVALVQGFSVQATIDPDAVPLDRYIGLATSLLRRAAEADGEAIPRPKPKRPVKP